MTRLDLNSFPPEAEREHRRWDRLHQWRVGVPLASMVCFLFAIRIASQADEKVRTPGAEAPTPLTFCGADEGSPFPIPTPANAKKAGGFLAPGL